MYDYITNLILSFLPDDHHDPQDGYTIYYVPHYVYNKIYRFKEYRVFLDCIEPYEKKKERN